MTCFRSRYQHSNVVRFEPTIFIQHRARNAGFYRLLTHLEWICHPSPLFPTTSEDDPCADSYLILAIAVEVT